MTPPEVGIEGRGASPSTTELLVLVLAIQAVVLLIVTPLAPGLVRFDITVYSDVAAGILGGGVLYRDVAFEYPPLAALPMLASRLGSGDTAFGVLMGGMSLGLTVLTWRLARSWAPTALDPVRPLLVSVLLVAIASPVLLWRFDLAPAAITMGSFVLAVIGFPLLSGVVLGLAVATKLYPLAVAPVLIAAYAGSRDREGLVRYVAGLAGTLLAIVAAIVIFLPDAVGSLLDYHLGRGVQIESTFGGVIEIGHLLGLTEGTVSDQFNSLQIDGTWAGAMVAIQPYVLVALLALVTGAAAMAFRREAASPAGLSLHTLVGYVTAAILAFMLGSRVLSPQYLAWVLPFVPFLRAPIIALMVAAFGLTFFVFPFAYDGLIALDAMPVLLLNLRNLLLAIVLVGLLRPRPGPDARWLVPGTAVLAGRWSR